MDVYLFCDGVKGAGIKPSFKVSERTKTELDRKKVDGLLLLKYADCVCIFFFFFRFNFFCEFAIFLSSHSTMRFCEIKILYIISKN